MQIARKKINNYLTVFPFSAIKCPPLPDLRHGQWNTTRIATNTPGTVVVLTCESDFLIEGDRRMNCTEYGQWTSMVSGQYEFPSCMKNNGKQNNKNNINSHRL